MLSQFETINEFLTELVADEKLLNRYLRDRGWTAKFSGLPEEKIEILLSDDLRRISDEISEEIQGAAAVYLMVITGLNISA